MCPCKERTKVATGYLCVFRPAETCQTKLSCLQKVSVSRIFIFRLTFMHF